MPTNTTALGLLLLGCTGLGCATTLPPVPPPVPAELTVPPGNALRLRARGEGVQIYRCTASGWVLEGPDAELIGSSGERIGRHYAGPTWEAEDGSKVVAQAEQKMPAPRAGAVPWLLLSALESSPDGLFGGVSYLQRVDTVGGAAPKSACDASHADQTMRVPYRATYYFYAR
jgi:hypothetical protein